MQRSDPWHGLRVMALGVVLLLAVRTPARAEVSAQDGYGPNGRYQVHVEIVPYVWLPAVNGTVKLGRGADLNISQGVPSVSKLTSTLTGAFIAAALVRYGPWSGEIDFQHVSAAENKGLEPGLLGVSRSLHMSQSVTRVAPGIGYQVYHGALGGVPATVDARVGFAFFASTASLELDRTGPFGGQRISSLDSNGSFAQPWVGLRADIYPWPRWRFEAGALVQGFGVGGGVWGWGASATASWAATGWLNLVAGFRALNTARNFESSRAVRSISLTGYGPVFGAAFSF
ncbi:MAG TPA: hypothetical protein VFW75_15075 [Acetobacteraceae bacterium]|nr:hypothetical protein [Acetobacteraceae bacterium]